jgi:UDP-2,3-diacylglucosamine pyrophosphatase LpxH
MNDKKRILSIGDIHGDDLWMDFTHGSTYDYKIWRNSVDEGEDPMCNLWKDQPHYKLDKIIFIGDYVDSFTLSNEKIKQNLLDIIHLKNMMPDKVVLILGNHDVQYIVPNQICSGFRSEMAIDLEEIFRNNRKLFKLAHREKNYLWTHGGVTKMWLEKEAIPCLMWPDRFHSLNRQYVEKPIDEMLNFMWEANKDAIFKNNIESGGFSMWSGPLWTRKQLNQYPLKDFNQIVGHTPTQEIKKYSWEHEDKTYTNYHIDCMGFIEEPLILEI